MRVSSSIDAQLSSAKMLSAAAVRVARARSSGGALGWHQSDEPPLLGPRDRAGLLHAVVSGGMERLQRMSDHVFEFCLRQPKPPMIIAASSIHAIDGPGPGSYSLNDGDLAALAERRFEDLPHGPPVLLLKTLSTVRASGY